MNARLRLPSFVMGPEPRGRGYGLLAQSGFAAGASWQGNVPLVLLEWAKLRIAEPFSGRFPVAGGAIALKAAYLGEGSGGSIARANGVFIDEASLPDVLDGEQSLFAAIPMPSDSIEFGTQLLDVDMSPYRSGDLWPGLGLAWQDRQLFVPSDTLLDDVVFAALGSIDPPALRQRIRGWCTTGVLSARGDFLPIHNSNLLVTRSTEPLAQDRFLAATLRNPPEFDGERVAPPETHYFWSQMTRAFEAIQSDLGSAMAWQAEMAAWSHDDLAWRAVEILSQRRTDYPQTVAAIIGIGDLPGEGRAETAAQTIQLYLAAVAHHDRGELPRIMQLFRHAGTGRPHVSKALEAATLLQLDAPLAQRLDDDALGNVIRLFRDQIGFGQIKAAEEKLELLDQASVWLALRHKIRSDASSEGQRRPDLIAIRDSMGISLKSRDRSVRFADRHKLFLKRKVLARSLADQRS